MKTLKYILAILMLNFYACNKDRQWEEGDKNTYTWKGQLVKDCHGEPVKNETVFLEAGGRVSPDEDWDEIVASGSTDENGYFSLTYKQVKGNPYPNIALKTENRSLLGAPINQDIERDVAIEDCFSVFFTLDNEAGWDSLYLGIGKPYDRSNVVVVYSSPVDTSSTQPVQIYNLKGGDFEVFGHYHNILSHTWDNEPKSYEYIAAPTLHDYKKALYLPISDSIPELYAQYRHDRTMRGYPKIDTIYLSN